MYRERGCVFLTCLQGTDVQLRWLFVSLGWSIGKLFFFGGGGGDYVVYLLFLKSAFLVVCRSHGVEFILLYIIHPSTHSHLFMKWSVVSLIRY